jgi:site-specific recombinase XerD
VSDPPDFPGLLERFFADRLMRQRQASPHTIAGYRDTFRLLLLFAQRQLGKPPSSLVLEDLDSRLIGAFLDHLEKERENSSRSRNVRLAAVHSFFQFVAFQEPAKVALIQRVLAMPGKRFDRRLVGFLAPEEVDAILAAPDRSTWVGRRDYVLLLLAVQTGLRVSELTAIRPDDIRLGPGAHVQCMGKGRKERCVPLRKEAASALRVWMAEIAQRPWEYLFPSARGGKLSPDGVQFLLAKHVEAARRTCPSLIKKRVSPHVLRHTTAMELLRHGVDRSVIALWLGHESMETTQAYLAADLEMKQRALAKLEPGKAKPSLYRPDDKLLAFLKGL